MDCEMTWQTITYAESTAADIRAAIDVLVAEDMLNVTGLAKREVRADWNLTPKAIKDAIPGAILAALHAGKVPSKGFGLGADTGSGKTMALAAIMRAFQKAYRLAWADRLVERTRKHPGKTINFHHRAVWLTWPDAVTTLRAHAIDGEAERILERAESAPLLILDDLGRERMKGNYLEDWAASQLDRVINRRYRDELPTLWTTNLTELQLTEIYGAALVSRLTEDAPLIWLDKLPSLRIKA
jgi:hypothetical protein